MIKKLFSIEKTFSVSKATIIIAVFTLLAKLVGLYRERLLATHIGVGSTLDIYYASFRVPDFVFNLLILGTLSVAFIPVFTKYLTIGKEKANELANTIVNLSFLGMFVVCAGIFIFAGPITRVMVPGFNEAALKSTISLTRLLLISPLIFTLANVTTAVLQSLKKFLIVTLASSLYNVGIIVGYYVFYNRFGLTGLGYGVILGALLLLAVQLPGVYAQGFYWKPYINIREKGAREVARLFLPRIFGVDSSQLSLLIGSIIGSLLMAGSITILNLANNLQFVPVSVFALSTAVAAFPSLAESFARKNIAEFIEALEGSMIQILYIIIPITILMLVFRAYIVRLIYGAGKFNWDNTILTFQTLGVFSFALVSESLIPLLSRAFYAMHNTKTPVLVGLFSMVLNVLLSYQLAKSQGVLGIAMGFVLANVVNCIILFFLLHRKLTKEAVESQQVRIFDTDLLYAILKITFASLIMGMVAYSAIYSIAPYLNTRTVIGLLIQAGIASGLSVVAYLVITFLLGLEETTKILKFFDAFLSPKSRIR